MSDIEICGFGLSALSKPEAFYSHFKENKLCESVAEAERYVKLWRKQICLLAGQFPVYVRAQPEFYSENQFESSTLAWRAVARYTVADTGLPGLHFLLAGEWHHEPVDRA